MNDGGRRLKPRLGGPRPRNPPARVRNNRMATSALVGWRAARAPPRGAACMMY